MTAVMLADYDPLAPGVQADPYPYYAALRHEAPVHHLPDLGLWVVSRYDDVRRVMHDHSTFSSQAMAAAVMRPTQYALDEYVPGTDAREDEFEAVPIIGTDGATHSRLRHIVNRGFTPRRIAELEPEMRRVARAFARDLAADGGGDLQEAFAVPFPAVVIAELLGVDPARRAEFRRWSEHMVLAVFEQPDDDQQQEIAHSIVEMAEWLDAGIAERAGTGGEDLISVLLRAELDGGALSHDELRAFVFTLLVAGSITTAYLIGNGVLALLANPPTLEAVRADASLVPALVEETLRYDAPTQLMLRTATRETEIAGTTIPPGATLAALLGSANRDEDVFADPDRFDLRRATTEHLAFGHGVHFCLGAALARLETRVAFEELLAHAPLLRVDGEPERIESLVFRGPTRLPVRT